MVPVTVIYGPELHPQADPSLPFDPDVVAVSWGQGYLVPTRVQRAPRAEPLVSSLKGRRLVVRP